MNRNLKIATGLISLGFLATLIYKLTEVPGGMFLSGLFLGGMWIAIILVHGLLASWLIKLLSKKIPFWTVYFSLTSIAFASFHYQMYSVTLKIIVPENYTGQVNLIKSNVDDNILILDSNGIGYLTKWTFNHSYLKPIVIDENGKNLSKQLVGFNNSSFFGVGNSTISDSQIEIRIKSFEIVPEDKLDEKQFNSNGK